MLLLLDNDCPFMAPVRPWDRIVATIRAGQLDADLARGVSPDASAPLALRAQVLARPSVRAGLAQSAERILAMAAGPAGPVRRLGVGSPAPVPVRRDRVRAASGELGELIRQLRQPGPVPVRGVAKVRMLLADGGGPLYHRASRDDLRARLRDASEALTVY